MDRTGYKRRDEYNYFRITVATEWIKFIYSYTLEIQRGRIIDRRIALFNSENDND